MVSLGQGIPGHRSGVSSKVGKTSLCVSACCFIVRPNASVNISKRPSFSY